MGWKGTAATTPICCNRGARGFVLLELSLAVEEACADIGSEVLRCLGGQQEVFPFLPVSSLEFPHPPFSSLYLDTPRTSRAPEKGGGVGWPFAF